MKTATLKWSEKILNQRQASDAHFLLTLAQDAFPSTADPVPIYDRALQALGLPYTKAEVYFVGDEKNPDISDRKPDLLVLEKLDSVVAYSKLGDPNLVIFCRDLEELRKIRRARLEQLSEDLQPIVKLASFIAANREKITFKFSWDNPLVEAHSSETHFTPFLFGLPNCKASVELISSKNEEKIEISSPEAAFYLWRFLYFILPGLFPHRFVFCEVCDRVIYKLKNTDRYCSKACSQKAYRRRKKATTPQQGA